MSASPAPSANFFIVINGQTNGPHRAEQIMAMWRAGTIANDTLICQEGGAAWVPLAEFEPALRSVLPPAAPGGYAPARQAPAQVTQVVVVKGDSTRGIRIGTILAAIILFFVPWVEVKCAGSRMLYQTGVGAMLNRATPDDSMKQMAEMGGKSKGAKENFEGGDMGSKAGYSYLAGGAALALVLALALALSGSGRRASGALAAIALGCLVAQLVIGFPFKSAVTKEMDEMMKTKNNLPTGQGHPDPGDEMAKTMFGKMTFTADFSPWFYAELGLLVLAAGMGLAGGAPQSRR